MFSATYHLLLLVAITFECAKGASTPYVVGKIAEEKCIDYGELVYVQHDSPLLDLDSNVEVVNECPIVKASLILNGEPTQLKEFPHMAQIGYYEHGDPKNDLIYSCAGSLISENYILTAAHCLRSTENGPAVRVRLGEIHTNVTENEGVLQVIDIAERIRHPNYRARENYNDIALLRLEQDVEFTPFVRPLCLNTKPTRSERHAIATGWGLTENFTASNLLLKVKLDLVPHETCALSYRKKKKLPNGLNRQTQLCAGSDSNKDTCFGDSGGPLQVYHESVYCMYTQIGITSFGTHCGLVPGVYTNVYNYLEWIEKQVWV